ncbi:MAG: hypothetical protein P9L99_00025, partial [Candidatus Lernaella stagnicola]|nr:hypothetical protein [Candidatus Lernaella stagnicola]
MNATRFQLVAIIALPVFMFAITFAACDDDDDDNDNDDDDTAGDDDDDDNDDDDNDNNDDDDDDDNDDDDDPCVVWHHELPGGIAESVSLSDTTNEAWVAVQLNDESLLHFALDGGGAPDFSVDLMTFETERSLVAAAGSVSLG